MRKSNAPKNDLKEFDIGHIEMLEQALQEAGMRLACALKQYEKHVGEKDEQAVTSESDWQAMRSSIRALAKCVISVKAEVTRRQSEDALIRAIEMLNLSDVLQCLKVLYFEAEGALSSCKKQGFGQIQIPAKHREDALEAIPVMLRAIAGAEGSLFASRYGKLSKLCDKP
ncbi:hypothetical protein SH467x_003599 [Pirellulaceae bacterium SH467]